MGIYCVHGDQWSPWGIGRIDGWGICSQSEGLTERINEPPWGRCLQGAVDVRWVVVLCCVVLCCVVLCCVVLCCVVLCCVVLSSSPRIASSRALGITVTLLRSNGDAFMELDDGATLWVNRGRVTACLYQACGTTGGSI